MNENLIDHEMWKQRIKLSVLSARLEISASHLANIRDSKTKPNVFLAYKIAKELKVSINYLFKLD